MRVAKIVGTVTLGRAIPSFEGARLRLAFPLTLDELQSQREDGVESIVLWDQSSAGVGSLVALSEGPEAAQPFRPQIKPIDAYNAAILDHLEVNQRAATTNDSQELRS